MKRRLLFLSVAVGLVAAMAFGTPSQAGSVPVMVTASFTSSSGSLDDSITAITFDFTGLTNPITDIEKNILAYNYDPTTPPFVTLVTTTVTRTGAEQLTVGLSPDVFTASGAFSFETSAPSSDLPSLSSDINVSASVVGTGDVALSPLSFATAVPGQSSIVLLSSSLVILAFVRWRRSA
jgi:hypothetical protein